MSARPPWALARRAIRTAARPILFAAGLALVGYLIWDLGPGSIWEAFRRLSWGVLLVLVFPAWIVVVLDTLGWRLDYFAVWPYVKNLVPQHSIYGWGRMQEVWRDN
jgi:hypothetical protein